MATYQLTTYELCSEIIHVTSSELIRSIQVTALVTRHQVLDVGAKKIFVLEFNTLGNHAITFLS